MYNFGNIRLTEAKKFSGITDDILISMFYSIVSDVLADDINGNIFSNVKSDGSLPNEINKIAY